MLWFLNAHRTIGTQDTSTQIAHRTVAQSGHNAVTWGCWWWGEGGTPASVLHGPRCGRVDFDSPAHASVSSPLCGGSVSSQGTPQCTWRGAVRSHDFGLLERAIASPSSPLTQADGRLARAASDMGAREMGARDADAAAGSTADAGSWHAAVSPSAFRRTSRSGMDEGMCSATRSWTSLRVSVYPAHEGSCRLLGRKAPTRLSRL